MSELSQYALYAQVLPAAAPPSLLDDTQIIMPQPQPSPEGSAPFEDDTAFTAPHAPDTPQQAAPLSPVAESALQRDLEQERQDYFGDRQSRAGFKLFEPSRYEFLQDDTPLLLPQPQGEEEDWDNYYRYSRKYLDNIIAKSGGGIELREKSIEYLEILNPSLLVPIYGTTISLTGRKTFGLKYVSKKYKGTQTLNSRDFSGVDFEQEMQVKLQGKISDRIFVDIDYDDQSSDAQNISIAYRGKGEEFVQSADFGDIELRLPNTEFLSYNKQIFGAQMHLKYAGANLRLIGSQTKGDKKNKQFKGDSVFDTVNIKDTQYIRRRY
ncbi:MAG: hypothetical protein LBG16_04385, partial [Elusimicrobiota bacterium]|nr:hypothetical protein [Elusimicrobiota bacterium]